MIQKNSVFEGIVSEQGKFGEGIVYIDDFPIYIPNVIPDDKVEFKILKVEKRRAFGKMNRILDSSPNRVKVTCSVAEQCGGCQLQHQSVQSQAEFRSNLLKSRLSRYINNDLVEFLPIITNNTHWETRNKMQFAFSLIDNTLQIGLYAPRSHRVVGLDYCHVMSKKMNAVLVVVKKWHKTSKVPVFDELTGQGVLRHITLRYSYATDELMVILTTGSVYKLDSFISAISMLEGVTSIYHAIQTNPSDDTVIGDNITHVWGNKHINDVVNGITCKVSPKSFMQANALLVKNLYGAVIDHLDFSRLVLDLYCGTGVLTCSIAKRCDKVIGVDSNPAAIADAVLNAKANNVHVDFYCRDVIDFLLELKNDNITVVVDPPRQGLSSRVIETLIKLEPEQLIYVSCYPDTLGRDLRLFIEGGYAVKTVQPVDMFLHTPHIEAVVILKK
ncbi:MAG: 23S rRNA (uracil(1939)-C(5))-methyltransferase RlmD [Candidatus Margulisiibacteriota bacterium]|nr:23S rRNA (uracil(1939)-C(5))-methyltransferase RlmD [Candidatus Margulisiibacteriota bacterium]